VLPFFYSVVGFEAILICHEAQCIYLAHDVLIFGVIRYAYSRFEHFAQSIYLFIDNLFQFDFKL